MTQAFKKIVSIAFVGVLSIFAHAAGASVLKTAPWQQNVYTNRFTIFCETAETVPGLSLQYGSGYGQSVEMTCVPGDSDGETQHYIYKGRANLDSVSGVIGSLVSYRIVAGGSVLKCPDGSDAAGSVWVWKDVPNERLTVALWSDNQVGAKVGDYDLDRFAYIKAAFGRMVAHDVDFGISTGDMTTSGSYADQTRPCVLDGSGILGRTRPYYVCFGNHDDYVAPDEMNKRYFETGSLDEPAYGTSERGAYYFYRGNVLFIFLHWPHDNQQGDYSVYRTWLQDLLATPRAKQAKFRLLFSHKPMFLEVWSEGSEGRNYDTSLYDIAVAGGVDMVVSGHMHGYERTVTDKGLVQLVNGGMGSLDHKEHVVNNYGDWTKMGGHRNIPYLWARQSGWKKPTLCGYFPVNMGCITSYCEMKIDGGELNVQAHGFCANGDYIGVFDDFTLVSKTDRTPPTPRRAVTAACADPSSFDTFVNTLVTNAKWKEYKDAVDEDFTYATADASKPVVNVSKDEITRFCAWLNNGASGVSYRLPTEAELRAKRTNLAGAVTEWTSTVDQETGWCRILGGNALASNTVWTASGDKPAIASSGCHANYLGFRLVKERGTEVVVTIRDWTGRKVQTVRGVTTTGTFALDVADYFNATVDYVTAFDGGTVSAAPSSDVVSGSVVTWTGVDRRLETEVFVQPRVPYKNFAQYNMGDPWIVKDPAANVWYVTSTMANDGLSVRQTTEFPTNRFGSSRTYRLKDHSEFGNYKYYIWAPEIHCIQGRWYAYLSASSNSGSSNYERPFVLRLPDGLTPYSSQWEFGAKLVTPGGDRWAIDGTILDDTPNGGKLYYIWSGWPGTSNGTQNLYLAEMATPTSFASGAARIQISTPTESWETLTKSPCKVNEGPAVLRHGDAVHIVYSCNGCWTDDYSLALLTCTGGNFANPGSWKKSSSRIFVSRPGAYGPGHCSFTRTADGQDMIVYHAKNVSGHSSDYYNYRDIRMQPIAWHGDTPVLGVPRPYDDTLTSDPLDLNADYYKEGPDIPPPEPETYDVTLESLLDEMCDADAATRLAALPWTGRLWSSYDRASVSTNDLTTWYANNDRSQFVRTETRSGRTECVMVDAKGPGALTRLWTANGYGTVYRFYVDGATEPVICGVGTNLIGGHVLCPAPLADEVSQLQNPAHRAQDLYLPIPFSQSLVVTAELKDIPPDDDEEETIRLWYNAEVRTYAEGTRVEPFSSAVLARAQDAIAAANAALRSPSAPVTDETKSLNGTLAAGVSRSVTFTRAGGAIRSISLRLADGDEPLRTVRVKITFDGETTVDAAVGQLFGAGYAATPYATVNGGVAADGTLTFRQVMPFASSCTVTLENTGRSSCSVVASSVAVGPYDWDDARSLHFGALGFEERALPTRRGSAGYYDLPWVKLEGRGQLVGNTLMLDNSQSSDWWGEGDEKIYVDGETFPSYFGTGTEDFFGYAWGHGKAFADHPFLALPLAGDSLTGGRRLVTAVRARRLDVVPFATSLKLDVEIWHWADCAMDYAPATFWYARPGVKVTPGGRGAEPEPPPVDPTAYGAADKKASTYTWKGGSGPWEHTTNWTPSASATYGIPSSKTYATANFPASLAEATTCTLTSDRSVKNVYFDSPNLTFVIDNATLTVTGTIRDGSYGAYNFGNTATGKSRIVFKGAAPGIYETTGDWRSNFGCLKGAASGVCTVRFEIPAANWAAAPIRTAATESKVCFWGNVKLEIDATALGVPSSGADVTVPLAQSAEGVFFLDNSADLNDCMSAVIARSSVVCAAGATGEVVRADNDLRFVLRGVRDPIPREIADGRAGDAITIPPGAAVDVTDPKRLVVNGAAYDVKPHYVFAATAAGGVALAIAPEEAEIAGFSVGADGVVTVTSGKAFDGFRYALEYADALPFGVAPSKTELRALGETRELSVSSEGAPRRFYRLVVTDRDVAP